MATRNCVYKDCGNYINLNDRKVNDVKLFSFPKNTERRQKWIELGKVPPNLPETMYFFCSDHFDKKYMAINNRRTVLVGEAVPFPYVAIKIDGSYEDENSSMEYYLYETNSGNGAENHDILDGQDIHGESTTLTSKMQENLQDEVSNTLDEEAPDEFVIFTDDERDNKESSVAYGNKRKLDLQTFVQTEAESSKSKISRTYPLHKPLQRSHEMAEAKSPQQLSAVKSLSSLNPIDRTSYKEMNEDEFDADKLVDSQRVITFIYKDDVYVQMRKEQYINEKMAIVQKLRKVENTIKAIKGYLLRDIERQ